MIYLNNKFLELNQSHISIEDRGFLLGDGLFETIKAYQGKLFCFKQHWLRLKNACAFLQIPFHGHCEELQKIAEDLLSQNGLKEGQAALRITVSRGQGPRGLIPPDKVYPTLLINAFPYRPNPSKEQSLCLVDIIRNEHSPLANIKSLNYLENILAKMAAAKAGADEAVLLNTQGRVASASCANLFLKTKSGKLITPSVSEGVLAGITRGLVIELAKKLALDCEEKEVSLQELENAEEIFLTNSLIEIQAVNCLNGRLLTIPQSESITLVLQTAFNEYRETLSKDRSDN